MATCRRCCVRDGVLVAAVEEERFRRIKHWAGFPTLAIDSVLSQGGIGGADVTHVAVSRDPRAHLVRKAWYTLRRRPHPALVRDRLRNQRRVGDLRGAARGRPRPGPRRLAAGASRRAPPCASRQRVLRVAVRRRGLLRHRRIRRLRQHVVWRGARCQPRRAGPGLLSALARHAVYGGHAVSGIHRVRRRVQGDGAGAVRTSERGGRAATAGAAARPAGSSSSTCGIFRHWSDGVSMEWERWLADPGTCVHERTRGASGPAATAGRAL